QSLRRRSWMLVVCLLFAPSVVRAVPPMYPARFASPGTSPGFPGSGGNAPRIPKRPPGVDAPARARQTAGTHYKVVVILLQFTDEPADTLNHPPSEFYNLLFSQGTKPTGSLRDYYHEVSRGAFDVDGIVTRWYTAPRTYAEYANNQGGFGLAPFSARQM